MTALERWTSNPSHSAEWDLFLNTPTGKALIDVLQDATPRAPRQPGLDSTYLLVESGRTAHHLQLLAYLQILRRDIPSEEVVEADFAPENNE